MSKSVTTKSTMTGTRHGAYLEPRVPRKKCRGYAGKVNVLFHVAPYADLKLSRAREKGCKVNAGQEKGMKRIQGLRGLGDFSDSLSQFKDHWP